MKKNSQPQFIGVIVSFIVIWFINDMTLVSRCTDLNGVFHYNTGECVLPNGDVDVPALGKYLIGIYFFTAITIALSVSFTIRKVFNIKQQ